MSLSVSKKPASHQTLLIQNPTSQTLLGVQKNPIRQTLVEKFEGEPAGQPHCFLLVLVAAVVCLFLYSKTS